MTAKLSVDRRRNASAAGALLALALTLGGCIHTNQPDIDTTAGIPDDYRLRHPIAITEAPQAVEVFVGGARGGLSATQRIDVISLAQTWLRDGTGSIVAEVPTNTPNARAAADSYREIYSLLVSAGVPSRGVVMRKYRSVDSRHLAAIRLTYPRITATAGPCGTWPDDLGPSTNNKSYYENKPYYNLGCAQQRNLAAMVANPSDLVQPRPETPTYAARRTYAIDKYRQGQATATTYPDTEKTKISNVGQ